MDDPPDLPLSPLSWICWPCRAGKCQDCDLPFCEHVIVGRINRRLVLCSALPRRED